MITLRYWSGQAYDYGSFLLYAAPGGSGDLVWNGSAWVATSALTLAQGYTLSGAAIIIGVQDTMSGGTWNGAYKCLIPAGALSSIPAGTVKLYAEFYGTTTPVPQQQLGTVDYNIAIAITMSQTGRPNTYFIDTVNGSDSNNGLTWGTAWAGIPHANSQMGSVDGATLYIIGASNPTALSWGNTNTRVLQIFSEDAIIGGSTQTFNVPVRITGGVWNANIITAGDYGGFISTARINGEVTDNANDDLVLIDCDVTGASLDGSVNSVICINCANTDTTISGTVLFYTAGRDTDGTSNPGTEALENDFAGLLAIGLETFPVQAAGNPVTLPTTPPSGYGGATPSQVLTEVTAGLTAFPVAKPSDLSVTVNVTTV